MRCMIGALTLLALTWVLLPAQGQPQGQPPLVDPADAVFQIQVLDRQLGPDGFFHGHGYATGFFIAADGTALTASHAVYLTSRDPAKYRVLAVVGKELYDATVICASQLPYDPSQGDPARAGIPLTRDVAEIRLAPSTMPEGHRELFFKTKDGQKIPLATAHLDALPAFPFLTVRGIAQGHVRIIGFGGISPIPYKWTVEGEVRNTWTSNRDGTPLFDVQSPNPAVPGDSGAPVLNAENQVVGLWAWHYIDRPDTGTAEAASALIPACR